MVFGLVRTKTQNIFSKIIRRAKGKWWLWLSFLVLEELVKDRLAAWANSKLDQGGTFLMLWIASIIDYLAQSPVGLFGALALIFIFAIIGHSVFSKTPEVDSNLVSKDEYELLKREFEQSKKYSPKVITQESEELLATKFRDLNLSEITISLDHMGDMNASKPLAIQLKKSFKAAGCRLRYEDQNFDFAAEVCPVGRFDQDVWLTGGLEVVKEVQAILEEAGLTVFLDDKEKSEGRWIKILVSTTIG